MFEISGEENLKTRMHFLTENHSILKVKIDSISEAEGLGKESELVARIKFTLFKQGEKINWKKETFWDMEDNI